jgi:hypothetical protein
MYKDAYVYLVKWHCYSLTVKLYVYTEVRVHRIQLISVSQMPQVGA